MTRFGLLRSLILTVLLAGCAPATSTAAPAQGVTAASSATLPPPVPPVDLSAQATTGPTEVPMSTPLPVATSRGPNLEATDPTTVSLASGGLQLVEFFRFT